MHDYNQQKPKGLDLKLKARLAQPGCVAADLLRQCTVKCKMYFRKFPIVFVAIVKWGTMHMSNCQIAYLHQFPNSFDNCKIYPSGGVAANLWGQCRRQDNLSPLALCQGIHCKYLSPLWFSEHESLWILGTQGKSIWCDRSSCLQYFCDTRSEAFL